MGISDSAKRFLISDELWSKLQPLVPARVNRHRFGGGRPPAQDRKCMNGIFFVLRTGCQWNALNATGICASSTAHDRFQQWVEAGVFLELWKAGLMEYDELIGLDCVRNDRRLLGITAHLSNVGIGLRQQTRSGAFLLEGRVAAQTRAQSVGVRLTAGDRTGG